MSEVCVYFIAAYSVMLFGAWVVRTRWTRPSFKRGAVSCLLLLVPFAPYARVEAQTALYSPELMAAVEPYFGITCPMIVPPAPPGFYYEWRIMNMRVLNRTQSTAEVYIVLSSMARRGVPVPSHMAGVLCRLERSGDQWLLVDRRIVWFPAVNLRGDIFPPYADELRFEFGK